MRNCLDCEKHNKIQTEAAIRSEIESLMAELAWLNKDR
jgi:hypothetical protein